MHDLVLIRKAVVTFVQLRMGHGSCVDNGLVPSITVACSMGTEVAEGGTDIEDLFQHVLAATYSEPKVAVSTVDCNQRNQYGLVGTVYDSRDRLR
jgi:hypothetical protein